MVEIRGWQCPSPSGGFFVAESGGQGMSYMNPVRVFARLAEGTLGLNRVGHSTGTPDYDLATCAGLCAGLPDHVLAAALVAYAGDSSLHTERQLYVRLLLDLVEIGRRERWQIERGPHRLEKLIRLAIRELRHPLNLRGDRESDGPKLTDKLHAHRAREIGVDKANWYRAWSKRYELCYGLLNDWTNTAWSHVDHMQKAYA